MIGFKANTPEFWAVAPNAPASVPQPGIGLRMPGENAPPGGQGMKIPNGFEWKGPEKQAMDPLMALLMGGAALAPGSQDDVEPLRPSGGKMPSAPDPESFLGIVRRHQIGPPPVNYPMPWVNFLRRPYE